MSSRFIHAVVCDRISFLFKANQAESLFFIIINLFLAMLGLCCCSNFSLVAESGGYSLIVVPGLLIVMVSFVSEPLGDFKSCGSQA